MKGWCVMARRTGSALVTAMVLLGIVTLLSVPVLQQFAQWRTGYVRLQRVDQAQLTKNYQAWVAQP